MLPDGLEPSTYRINGAGAPTEDTPAHGGNPSDTPRPAASRDRHPARPHRNASVIAPALAVALLTIAAHAGRGVA